jgi:hypothetical protein
VDLGDWDERDLIRLPDTSGLAVASLAAAVLSMGLLLLASLPALVMGILALRKIGASRGRLGGANLAIAAVILATLTTMLSVPVGIYLWDKMKDAEPTWDRPASRWDDPWDPQPPPHPGGW